MFGERIVSEGLAHYSYLIGDQNEALVIDPRIDCQIYIEKADKEECVIKNVLETHRNEDYLIGSVELRKRTDADIWHADDQLGIEYGEAVEEGQKWRIGRFKLEAIHTPGHTPGSMSYLLYGTDGEPWILFTGDLLFAGDIGRVDLLGMDKAEEMASMIYDSLFHKILRLGDEIIVCPAHGSGSVCGSKISERTWTTIGLEKKLNPKLQFEDKSSFIENVVEKLERPPYFREMEKGNKEGRFLPKNFPFAKPLKPEKFEKKIPEAQGNRYTYGD